MQFSTLLLAAFAAPAFCADVTVYGVLSETSTTDVTVYDAPASLETDDSDVTTSYIDVTATEVTTSSGVLTTTVGGSTFTSIVPTESEAQVSSASAPASAAPVSAAPVSAAPADLVTQIGDGQIQAPASTAAVSTENSVVVETITSCSEVCTSTPEISSVAVESSSTLASNIIASNATVLPFEAGAHASSMNIVAAVGTLLLSCALFM